MPLAIRVEQVERLGFGDEGQDRIFIAAFGAIMNRVRGLVILAGDAAIEVGIILFADLRFGLEPQCGAIGDVDAFRIGLFEQHDRDRDMARLCLDDALDRIAFGIGFGVFHQVQDDAGAARGRIGKVYGGDGVGALPVRGPTGGLIRSGAARKHLDLAGDHEGGIEAHAKLADQLRAFLARFSGEAFHERLRARPGDRAQRLAHFGGSHADAIIFDRQAVLIGVQQNADARLRVIAQQRRHGDAFIAQLLARIGGVGDEFAQEDVTVGIDRMHHHAQQLRNIRLESMGFGRGSGFSRHGRLTL